MLDDVERKAVLGAAFAQRFRQAPQMWVRAPGRVDLMGSHTDYNQGYVLTMTIDRDTWIAAQPRSDRTVNVYSLNLDQEDRFELDAIARGPDGAWYNYVRGVAAILQGEGYRLTGFDAVIHSTVPLGGGLSSSAALEVVTALTLARTSGLEIDPVQVALLCQMAECSFVGMNCGILDQYTSTLGQEGTALLLDCRHLSSETVPLPDGLQTVICDTRARRELTGSEYSERRRQCEEGARLLATFYSQVQTLRDLTLAQLGAHENDLPPVVARRCRFIIEENRRVIDMAQALRAGDRRAIGALTSASYAGARDLYEIGSPEMARMMSAMLGAPGVIGARQAGAGFGGCMVAFVEEEAAGAFAAHVKAKYRVSTGIEPIVHPVRASAGAGAL